MLITSFFTKNSAPKLGLTPTIRVWEVDELGQTLVVNNDSMDEVGDGFYKYDFALYDPDKDYVFRTDGGIPQLDERFQYGASEYARLEQNTIDNIANQVWDETLTDHLTVGSTGEALAQIKADTASISIDVNSIITLVTTLLKIETNRTKIDKTNATLTIYDDDCITPLYVFNLRDSNGMPSVTEVCERSPTPECP